MSRRRVAPALALAYAALAVLVATGALTGVDQWSVDHLMPGLGEPGSAPSHLDAIVPLLGASWDGGLDVVAIVVTLPAQALVSSALIGVCCLVLRRRGRGRTALVWGSVWILGNVVEVLCKSTLERPMLHAHSKALVALQSSFPSGHTLRSVLLAAAVAALWPAARRWVAAWAAASLVLLEVGGFHVPSDILGGLLLALLLIRVACSAERVPR